MPSLEQNPGSTVYNPFTLYFYDFFVLWLSNNFAWKCPTSTVQLPLFRSVLGKNHLDVGAGTGYYPSEALAGSVCTRLTLADLNPQTLKTSKRRIDALHGERVETTTLLADASVPLPLPATEKFDSISIFFLLHCMPGPPERKTRVFRALALQLAEDGVLAGSTILGREREMNWFAWVLMTVYNWKGVFGNWDDSSALFERGLRDVFEEVEVWVVGRVMLFTARKLKK